MTDQPRLYNSVAPLANVAALVALIERVQTRSISLPGMACYYGPSGFGKSTAAVYAENRFNAYQVQVKSAWTRKKFCQAVLLEMGLTPAATIGDMVDQIAAHLAITNRPLLIDEADHLVSRRMVEIVRDIYEGSNSPVILIGEELLPQKLKTWERVHGRMLDWVAAQPGTLADVGHLAPIYCPGIALGDDLKRALLAASGASIRRVCVNLDRVSEFARVRGLDRIGLEDWGARDFFTGTAPAPRKPVLGDGEGRAVQPRLGAELRRTA